MKGRAVAAAMAALLAAWAPAWGQEDETPRILVEKKIFAETRSGKKSFYEAHTVAEGESLWRIFRRRGPREGEDYAAFLKNFRRANPNVADPGRLKPGQRILVPSVPSGLAGPAIGEGKAVAYRVEKGDSLSAILAARGVSGDGMSDYLEAVKALNESVRDVDLIYAGRTLLIPTDRYFAAATSPPEPAPPTSAGMSLTKDAPPSDAAGEMPAAKPEAQLLPPTGPGVLAGSAVPPRGAGDNAAEGERALFGQAEGELPQPKPPYRGLLSDLLRGLGEKWLDRGMLYLPAPSGGEVVLPLEDYPVARFSTGVQELIDFRGSLPADVRSLVERTWSDYRVVAMGDAYGAAEMIDRVLRSAGYRSVEDGLARPLAIGESVSVIIPARWKVERTGEGGSLPQREWILVKEVPEKPEATLSAVLRYAESAGVRVVPYAVDPSAREGFLVAVEEGSEEDDPNPGAELPRGGLDAFDFSLAFLGIPPIETDRLTIGGKGDGFRLTIQPERLFAAGGKRYIVDTGRMSRALRALVRDSGYTVFPVGKDEPGQSVFRRVLVAAGLACEQRENFPVAGGGAEGFEIRATGLFVTSPKWLEGRSLRAAVVVRGEVDAATRALLRDFGVEIVGWSS